MTFLMDDIPTSRYWIIREFDYRHCGVICLHSITPRQDISNVIAGLNINIK
ncbi:MAG: hypothetical protein K9N06_12690 [Candidatus Cloacimonetes bacterium]|nr:hypothetical protein [Candidatus Cloacimonadota bacterium]